MGILTVAMVTNIEEGGDLTAAMVTNKQGWGWGGGGGYSLLPHIRT